MALTVIMGEDDTLRIADSQDDMYREVCNVSGMAEPYERLQQARRQAGFATAVDAARAYGWSEPTYRAHENGIRGLKRETAERYAKAFRVSAGWLLTGEGGGKQTEQVSDAPVSRRPLPIPVIGKAGAGVFREVVEYDDEEKEYIFDEPDPEFPHARRFALTIEGDSMNALEPRPILEGDRVICLDFDDLNIPLAEGDIVAVERVEGGRRERTVKEVEIHDDQTVLHPRSNNKRWKPIALPDDPRAEDVEVRVFGLVRSVNYGVSRGIGRRRG